MLNFPSFYLDKHCCSYMLMINYLVINCNDSRHSCLMLIIVWHKYSMLKPIFDKDVNFFSKNII